MKKYLIIISLLVVLLTGCNSKNNESPPESKIDDSVLTTENEPEISEGLNLAYDTELENADMDTAYGKYISYVFDKAKKGENTVFSPESLNSAFCIYKYLLDDTFSIPIDQFIEYKDYLSYESNDTFKTINRLWVNSTKEINTDKIGDLESKGIIYSLDMTDSASATAEKNAFVAQSTDNFITETPTVFDSNTVMDAMNVVYFKDKWENQKYQLDPEPVDFHNQDGTSTPVRLFEGSGTASQTSTAYGYTMLYNDGFTFTAILPKEGYSVYDIDFINFLNDNTSPVENYDVTFKMPEFEINSMYMCDLNTFGLKDGTIRKEIYTGYSEPSYISQVAKIKVDHKGTEAAAISEAITLMSKPFEEKDKLILICDEPFLYFIKDTINNDIAFIGVVNNM